jgi:homoserine kinase type II
MVNVFVLQHVHEMADGSEDVKFIGVYSSRQKAEAAVTRLRGVPGFSQVPDGFHIDEYPPIKTNGSKGMRRSQTRNDFSGRKIETGRNSFVAAL